MTHFILAADWWFENMLFAVRTPLFLQIFSAITTLGNTVVVLGITGVAGMFLLFSKHDKAYITGLVSAVIGAGVTNYVMKALIDRARPDGLIPSAIENSSSFPSAHATLAMVLYGFLAYLLCKLYPKHTAAIVTLTTLVILAVGFSRLYLGVHFPSDVLAGYLLGGLWLLVGIKVTAMLKRNDIVQ